MNPELELDDDGYPTEASLFEIEAYPIKSKEDCKELLDLIHDTIWTYTNQIWIEDGVYKVSTGGWSGNESIMTALEKNYMFWALCWQLSKRGGYYEFNIG